MGRVPFKHARADPRLRCRDRKCDREELSLVGPPSSLPSPQGEGKSFATSPRKNREGQGEGGRCAASLFVMPVPVLAMFLVLVNELRLGVTRHFFVVTEILRVNTSTTRQRT